MPATKGGGLRPAAGPVRAAALGGMAFANASVALVHGMSRPIRAVFHVLHGLSNAMRLDRGRFDAVKEKMASDALASGSPQNNPVVPTVAEIAALYDEAW